MLTNAQKEELRALVGSGKKIDAIKRYREVTGVGLREALEAITHLDAEGAAGAGSKAPAELSPKAKEQAEGAAMAEIRKGQITNAILKYQRHSKLSLKESKDAVDILNLVHRTDGRIGARLARSLLAMMAADQKQEAVTQLMSQAGYDEAEARKFIGTMGGAAGQGKAGCVVMILVTVFVLTGLAGLFFLAR